MSIFVVVVVGDENDENLDPVLVVVIVLVVVQRGDGQKADETKDVDNTR
jgi:hypothetical protein